MKLRGYSVLFVCALCVFVMCGAAAAVAQDGTPENAAEGEADAAKEKGELALGTHKKSASDVSSVVSSLTVTVKKINALETQAKEAKQKIGDTLRRVFSRDVELIKTDAEAAKTAVEALAGAEAATFRDEQTKTALADKTKEVELYIPEVEKAAAALTGNISAIDVVLEKASALENAAKRAGDLWTGAVKELGGQRFSAGAAVKPVEKVKRNTESCVTSCWSSIYPGGGQKVAEEMSGAFGHLESLPEKVMFVRDASQNSEIAAEEAAEKYDELWKDVSNLRRAAEYLKQTITNMKDVGEARAVIIDMAKTKGDETLSILKEFTSNVSSVFLTLNSAIWKIGNASEKASTWAHLQDSDSWRVQISQEIEQLKTDAESAKTAVEALAVAGAATFENERKKAALTSRMDEVRLSLTGVEEAAAALTGNISAFDVVIEKASALERAAEKASDLWTDALKDLGGQLFSAAAAVRLVETMKKNTEVLLSKFRGKNDVGASTVKMGMPAAFVHLKLSLGKLIFVRDALQKATKTARKASEKYSALEARAYTLKKVAEDWKQRAAGLRVSEEVKAVAVRAKTKGDEVLGIHERFASNVSGVMSSLDLALGRITAWEVQVAEIKPVEEPQMEQILREIDQLKTDAGAAVERLEAQPEKLEAAVGAVNTTITAMENALKSFGDVSDPKGEKVKNELLDAVENILKPSREKLMRVRDASKKATEVADDTREENTQSEEKARRLKEAAEDWTQRVEEGIAKFGQKNLTAGNINLNNVIAGHISDYSAGPLCSLALPAFFFCWCVLFGV